jgi:type I restriction enzyme S subunit
MGQPDLPLLSVYRDLGVVPRAGREDNFNKASDDLSSYRVVHQGDLVLNKMKTWQGSLGISDYVGIVSPAYFVCEQIGSADARFLHHLLRSRPLIAEYGARSKGIRPSQWDLPWGEFRDIRVNLPPAPVQREIADFLDAETARIDALMEKKRRMIELVDERWQTCVRDRLARLAPVLPLKRRWRVTDCKHRTPTYVDDGFPVVSPGDVVPGRLDLSVCHRFVDETDLADLTEGRKPKRGDIIYSRNASAGIAALVDTDAPFCMGQDVCLITSLDQDQRFLMYALNSIGMDQLEPLKIGSTITRINVDQIGELEIPAPDPEMQRGVANELDAKRSIVDASTARLSQQIRLLQERRQALITAAVTGELDVEEAA